MRVCLKFSIILLLSYLLQIVAQRGRVYKTREAVAVEPTATTQTKWHVAYDVSINIIVIFGAFANYELGPYRRLSHYVQHLEEFICFSFHMQSWYSLLLSGIVGRNEPSKLCRKSPHRPLTLMVEHLHDNTDYSVATIYIRLITPFGGTFSFFLLCEIDSYTMASVVSILDYQADCLQKVGLNS